MFEPKYSRTCVEPLEARIAPATLLPTIKAAEAANDANPFGDDHFVKATHDKSAVLVKAGQVLSTSSSARDGTYLLFVEKGQMLVFFTDLNNNKDVDFNEITGIAAGDGLRFTSFVDIHGDIVTNLDADTTLTDSNNNTSGSPLEQDLKGDGLVLNNARIEAITLRSLTAADLTDQNADGLVDDLDVQLRLALSSYSIHGQVLAGKGFGVVGDKSSGLLIDSSGFVQQETKFNGSGLTYYIAGAKPTIGAIRTGTAASGEYFSFGISGADNVQGTLRSFSAPTGQVGGDIYNVRSADLSPFNLTGLFAGNGGIGARGGNIDTVRLNGDNASGYQLVAGDGGSGPTGGLGGSILGFTDLGSVTGQVLLDVGAGGTGTTGAGGNGGTLGLGTIPLTDAAGNPIPPTAGQAPLSNININAGFQILLGDGGDGFTSGGNGASLTKAVIGTPEGAVVYGRAVVSTTHDGPHDPVTGQLIRDPIETGTIGQAYAVDFDQDGFTDIAFTTSAPDQLVVQFGDGLGGFRTDAVTGKPVRIYLDGPTGAEALAVGDFNGDGHQDLVVASSEVGNFAGFVVFLAKWEDKNANGLTVAEDLNANGTDDFLGFYTGRTSVLPSLSSGDPAGSPRIDNQYRYVRSASAINDIAVGDFNGDGFTEIAVAATYIGKGNLNQNQVVIVMTPDFEDGRQTGQFYADVGTKKVGDVGANPFVPFTSLGEGNDARIEATGLSIFSKFDLVVGETVAGLNEVNGDINTTITNGVALIDFSFSSVFGPVLGRISFESVDTARALNATNLQPAFMRDFTIVDFNDDGRTDFVAITEDPEGFLVAVQGDALGNGVVVTKNPLTSNNQGYFFGGNNTNQRAIRTTELYAPGSDPFDADGSTTLDDVVVLGYSFARTAPAPAVPYSLTELSIWDFANVPADTVSANPGVDLSQILADGLRSPSGANSEVVAFDRFAPTVGETNFFNYATAVPTTDPDGVHAVESFGAYGSFRTPLAEHFIDIQGGDGGDGIIGKGGIGGSLGGGIRSLNLTDALGVVTPEIFGSLDITLPANVAFSGLVKLVGGNGGNGFTSGGAGGGVLGANVDYTNAAVTYHSVVQLFGGDGGFGISGAGGAGGSLVGNSLETGVFLEAGDGGRGKTGGAGGSITGHGLKQFADNREPYQIMYAGNGGDGVIRGGAGGNISNYHGLFNLFLTGNSRGVINYVAGNGGSAVSGPAGNGGDVNNVSPFVFGDGTNRMSGDVYLRGGNGGNGLSGGRGGDVIQFTNSASEQDSPAVLSFLGGSGGDGSKGAGGRGGDVRQITSSSKGTPSVGEAPAVDGVPTQRPIPAMGALPSTRASVYDFNRVMAGDGGSSSGGTGGAGGTIANIVSGNVDDPYAVIAGAGGYGLLAGGKGGSVLFTRLDLGGGPQGKGLVIAGAGGDAGAFIPNPLDPSPNQAQKAYGGRIGRGGDGGEIRNFTQAGGIGGHVDLIAGNGGDTVNYGRVGDQVTNVGKGGSVTNVQVAANIGNIEPTVAIKSYNDLSAGQSIAEFVESTLRNQFVAGNIADTIGNVGIVVGAAGRLKSVFTGFDDQNQPIFQSLPAFKGVNGELANVSARGIMSAIAGSVDRIASLRAARNITVIAGGEVGTDKSLVPANYLDKFGNVVPEPVTDGVLIDGAMVVAKAPTPSFPPGNVFVLP